MVGRTASGKTTVSRLLPRFYDVSGGSVRVDGHDVRDLTHRQPALSHRRSSSTSRFSSPRRSATTSPTADPTRASTRSSAAARAAGAEDFILALDDGLRRGRRRTRLHALRWPAPADRYRAHAARQPADPYTRRRHERGRRTASSRQIHEGLQGPDGGRTTLIVAHRLSTIGLADRVVLLDRGTVRGGGDAQRTVGELAAVRGGAVSGRRRMSASKLRGEMAVSFGGGGFFGGGGYQCPRGFGSRALSSGRRSPVRRSADRDAGGCRQAAGGGARARQTVSRSARFQVARGEQQAT